MSIRHIYSLTSFLFILSLLSPTQLNGNTRYELVTSDDMLLDGCVYLIVAKDIDIAAGKPKVTNNKFRNFPSVIVKRDGSDINIDDVPELEEFCLRHFHKNSQKDEKYPWGFVTVSQSYVVTHYTDGYLGPLDTSDDPTRTGNFMDISISIDPTHHSASTEFLSIWQAFAEKGLRFNNIRNDEYELGVYRENDESALPIQLYRKNIYDLHIKNQKPAYNADEDIEVHVNVFSQDDNNSKGYLFYCFNDGEMLTANEVWSLCASADRKTQSAYQADGTVKIAYPGGNKTLWVVREHAGSQYYNDILRIDLTDKLPVTNEADGHFTHPKASDCKIGQAIDFNKQEDVKIYYTLDGRDPIIENVETSYLDNKTANADPNAADGDVSEDDDHSGLTYDLDIRPIIYEGFALDISYVAVKNGHAPSPVSRLSLKGESTGITDIETDTFSGGYTYFNLQGIRIAKPHEPGIYLRLTPQGKSEKIIIR